MTRLFIPSLVPILTVAALLAALAFRWGRRGVGAYCLSLVAWATSLLLAVDPDTRRVGESLLMVGFFVPAAYLHAVSEDLRWHTRLVGLFYVGAVGMTALGALPQGLFLQDGGTTPGPLWGPMFALAGVASLVPLLRLWRALPELSDGERERARYLLFAGVLGTFGGGTNILLMMTAHPYPAGLYMVLGSLALLAWVVQSTRLPDFGRFVDASLRYSLIAALLSTLFLLLALWVTKVGGGASYSWGAAFLLFLVVLVGQPLLFWARGQLAASFFAGKGGVEGITRALAESEARAEHAGRLAEIGTLASAVAHEVRNPLGVITAATTLLERQGADPATLDEIRQQVRRAAHFADDLLEYGRPEPLSLRPVDLTGAASMAASEVRQALPLDPMPEITVSGEAPPVEGDLGQLARLIGILVENAALAGAGRIAIRVSEEPEAVRVELDDDGPGVPEAIAPRLFEPFVTGRSRQSPRPGTGLGLAIARGVAERHHGHLRHDGRSTELGGARFVLEIPRRQPLPSG
ncbi:MAG: HAMP domain-containing histidine kinase [Alphaproteobacteria bacterium]|nr:HAMP domain-containing histidine kinase [Alphaproteobacteria bacterium]